MKASLLAPTGAGASVSQRSGLNSKGSCQSSDDICDAKATANRLIPVGQVFSPVFGSVIMVLSKGQYVFIYPPSCVNSRVCSSTKTVRWWKDPECLPDHSRDVVQFIDGVWVVLDALSNIGVLAKDHVEFFADCSDLGRHLAKFVQCVADSTTGRIMAGKDENLDLVNSDSSKIWINLARRKSTLGLTIERDSFVVKIRLDSQIDGRFTLFPAGVGRQAFVQFLPNVPVHGAAVVPLDDRFANVD